MTDGNVESLRAELVARIARDRATLAALEEDIAARAAQQETVSMDPLDDIERPATTGQRLADGVAGTITSRLIILVQRE